MRNMIASIAWRNIWRNKLRSLVIVLAIAVGIIGAVTMNGFMMGMVEQRVESVIDTEISNIQIHNPNYLLNQEIKYHISNTAETIEKIKTIPEIKEVSSRIVSSAMATSASTGFGINLYGIHPEIEKKVSSIYKHINQGVYLKDGQNFPVVIGEKLSQKLNLNLDDKLIVTLTDTTGTITSGAFNIVGIYKTADDNFDVTHAYVKQSDLRKMINYPPNVVNELAVRLNKNDDTNLVINKLFKTFSSQIKQKQIIVQSWSQLNPADESMVEMMDYFSFLFLIIIFTALAFAIINVMLMAILERTREFGMLMALGMNKRKVFRMILLETIFLSVIGGLTGIVLGAVIVKYFSSYGFDLSSVASGMNSIGYNSIIYFKVKISFYLTSMVMVVLTAVVSGIFPALKALKLQPADAIREDS
ncbi:putative Efflux ABC transporter, permease protein [uncultured Paludibacter sp.]|uniref:Putative Efflux ABC transporter, permease protein n=1 Tax=uncultured Paludibacter sp. TaxID=497635 RepID=A0A653AEI8_9BACT|nr:putative Efflux ABC transporter, permease protein [uncultured Paludibacter sp.]